MRYGQVCMLLKTRFQLARYQEPDDVDVQSIHYTNYEKCLHVLDAPEYQVA